MIDICDKCGSTQGITREAITLKQRAMTGTGSEMTGVSYILIQLDLCDDCINKEWDNLCNLPKEFNKHEPAKV